MLALLLALIIACGAIPRILPPTTAMLTSAEVHTVRGGPPFDRSISATWGKWRVDHIARREAADDRRE